MTTTTAIAPQAVETAWVCDECAGDGQIASQLKPVDNPADRSLNSDDPHQLSISGRSVPRGEAAKSFGATTTAMKCQLHPTALGIQGTNPRQEPT